jgi:two-component system phosphate regulon response regulator PhoB
MHGLILIVEDEADLSATVAYNLEREGYQVRIAATGRAAMDEVAMEPAPDLVLLDLMLPDISGTEICKHIRETERTREIPIIMLTAKSEEIDRVVGFEVGADDYVAKPFSVRELMLRVRALLRRTMRAEQGADIITFGKLRMDQGGHRVWLDGGEVKLTALEFRLLSAFITRRGRVQSRDALLSDVWGIDADVTTRTVDTHVKRLREKLGQAGAYIETLRGVGYRFRDQLDDK